MKLFIILACLFACIAMGEDRQKPLDALRAELRAEIQASSEKDSAEEKQHQTELAAILSELSPEVLHTTGRNRPKLLMALSNLQMTAHSEKLLKLCNAILLDIRQRSTEETEALLKTYTATLRDALLKGLDVTSPNDLEAPLAALAGMKEQIQDLQFLGDRRLTFCSTSVEAVEKILHINQRGLLQPNAQTPQRENWATEAMNEALEESGAQITELMPRSELMGKIQTAMQRLTSTTAEAMTQYEVENKAHALLANIKTLEDLETALAKIEDLISGQMWAKGYSDNGRLLRPVRGYLGSCKNLRAGSATSLYVGKSSGIYPSTSRLAPENVILAEIKEHLLHFALPRVLQTPDLVPDQGENTEGYLQRVLTLALSSSDWQLLSRVLDTAQAIELDSLASPTDMSALRDFLAALTEDGTRQPAEAVSSYLAVLHGGSLLVPAEYIGERLKIIRQETPDDYEIGTHPSRSYVTRGPGPNRYPVSPLQQALQRLSTPPLIIPAAVKADPGKK